jgi:hypothetical protein
MMHISLIAALLFLLMTGVGSAEWPWPPPMREREAPPFPQSPHFPRLPRFRLIAPLRTERILRTHATEIQDLNDLPFAKAINVRCAVSVSGVRATIAAENTVVNDWWHDGLWTVSEEQAGDSP